MASIADEDPTNFWPADFAARGLVPGMLKLGISANAISIGGFLAGAVAALILSKASGVDAVLLSFVMSALWLLADSLDGMVARANGTASAIGRELDGLCDHGVFILLYVALALSMRGLAGWCLVLAAALAHVIQANFYEAERGRFKRRVRGATLLISNRLPRNPLVRFYDGMSTILDAGGEPFERVFADTRRRTSLAASYRAKATAGFRVLTSLSADARILILYGARLLGSPRSFCWIEIGPMSIATVAGILWHRAIEHKLVSAGERDVPYP